jgi:hypothetical protein
MIDSDRVRFPRRWGLISALNGNGEMVGEARFVI